jgi:hypothetical protein
MARSNVPEVKGRGRRGTLDTEEGAKEVAAHFVAGMTRPKMAEFFGVSEWTITQWRRDPRVKIHAQKMIEDRVLSVTRKVDAEIEGRLQNPGDLTVKELLEIRKEFLAGSLRAKMESIDDETMTEAMQLLEQYPELAGNLAAVLSGEATIVPKGQVVEGTAEESDGE